MIQTTDTSATGEQSLSDVFDCLAHGARRQILGRLVERAPYSLTRRDLATDLVQNDVMQAGGTDADLQQALRALRHTHLPKLEAAGLISRETARGTVTITDHPAFEDTGIVAAIESESDGSSDSLDRLFGALGNARRRTILGVLHHRDDPIDTETLARTLGAREQEIPESEVPSEDVETIVVDLVHCQLPALADSGLVTYDSDAGTVAYEGHPQMTAPWTHSLFAPEFRRRLTDES
jgi:DNA-binding transcriptional ArsR family regulator